MGDEGRSTAEWGLRVFGPRQLDEVHEATLEVLSRTGVEVHLPEARAVLAKGGCEVDDPTMLVKLPPQVVQRALSTAPGRVLLAARDSANDYWMGGRQIGFTTFGCGIRVVDPDDGEVRDSTKDDVADVVRVCDGLPYADIATTAVVATDKPEASYDLHMAEAAFCNTTKHVQHLDVSGGANCRRILRMAAAIAGGPDALRERPLVSVLTCPTSPLMLHDRACEIIIEMARWGCPVNVVSMAMAGASAPVTLAGALVTHNAEVLTGVVLAQLTVPGAPVIYGSSTTMFDLRIATAPTGAPEQGMLSAMAAELAHHYGLPCWVSGGWADAKLTDAQAGHEKTVTALLPALAGANMMYGMGELESGNCLSYEQLMLDHEIAGMIRRVVRGTVVDSTHLGVDVIHSVGARGDFLREPHTRLHMADEQSVAGIFDRRTRGAWLKRGATDAAGRALTAARALLRDHRVEPLDPKVTAALRDIIAAAEG